MTTTEPTAQTSSPPPSLATLALLVAASGWCALVYQTVWLRQFRLLFGASTLANAAVTAIFMGGLGFGGLFFGPRAERHPRPLRLYARLEAGIAVWIVLYPLLLAAIRAGYLAVGGTTALGTILGTLVRLALASLVLGPPTFLMGGTLAAAGKAVTSSDDPSRASVAALYGANTAGAVAGAFLTTFFLLEAMGCWTILALAGTINLGVAGLAWRMANSLPKLPPPPVSTTDATLHPELVPPAIDLAPAKPGFLYGALAMAGGVFFLMEVVWYRLLAPILGGSTYTYGLILALVLAGIGAGGFLYAVWGCFRRPTLGTLALVSSLELLGLALPFALGDRLAVLAFLVRNWESMGFPALVAGWTLVAGLVVLPASVLTGFQFPLMIGLLGRGGRELGTQVGWGQAANTFGAIAGSLAGGFFLLPRFTSTGCWRIAALGLMGLAFAAVFASRRRGERALPALLSVMVVVGSTILLLDTGPTAFWRHGGVATGSDFFQGRATVTEMTDFLRLKRRVVAWETDGVESSLAQMTSNGLAVSSNGKIDGNSLLDAPTQVMLGLLCGLFHPQPKSALVVGLGSGSTAGWLGKIRPMERVDVVEIEPAMVAFARNCAAINAAALDNPKLHLAFNDAREYLQTSHRTWDLIVSEPSNPYRAGIVSLFTREFYQAVAKALNSGGVFGQWVQSYSIDKPTFDTILATLCSIFPEVSIWQTASYDLLFICSQKPLDHTVPRLRAVIQEEPYRSAFGNCWRADDLEGVLARFIANPATVRAYLASVPAGLPLNTDDRMIVEFGFARAVGKPVVSPIGPLLANRDLPANWTGFGEGPIDLGLVFDLRCQIWALEGMVPGPGNWDPLADQARMVIYDRFVRGDLHGVRNAWNRMASSPITTYDLCVLGEALADIGHGSAPAVLELLEPRFPGEAAALRARWLFGKRRYEESLQEITRAFAIFRTTPWTNQSTLGRAVEFAGNLVDKVPGAAEKLFQAVREPFCLYAQEEKRLNLLLGVAQHVSPQATVEALREFEPDTPWNGMFLKLRRDVYRQTGDPATLLAEAEYQEFRRGSGYPSAE